MGVRNYVTASALGSYFGVGFNPPDEQLKIDLGLVEPEFDDESKERMLWGTLLEDPVLDFWEKRLSIIITDRNQKLLRGFDDKLVGKIDGMTMLNGERTVVENKVSNSMYKDFTDNLGYVLQCQAYMYMTDANQALLLGLQNGKPAVRVLQRDERIINDIKLVVDFMYNVLIGFEDFANFPSEIWETYKSEKNLPELSEVDEDVLAYMQELADLKQEEKERSERMKELEGYLKDTYDKGVYEDDQIKVSISHGSRKGGLDTNRLTMYLLDKGVALDLEHFRKMPSTFKSLRITKKGD